MPTASYSTTSNWNIGSGYRTFSFNPGNDPSGVQVTNVSYRFFINKSGGGSVDLGDVDIYLRSPDGERQRIYYNFDEFGKDTDDGNDSDGADDYDIYFNGSDSKSRDSGFNGNGVNGTWKLEVDNRTGETLVMDYLTVNVDWRYPPAPDVSVLDLRFSGNPTYDELMTISADLENIGDRYAGPFEAHLYINGVYEEKSIVSLGLLAGQNWTEQFTFRVDTTGPTTAEVRLVNLDSNDRFSSNNSRTETFTPKQGDLTITDLRFTGNPSLGELMTIQADVKNIGDGNFIEFTKLQLFVNDAAVPDATSVLTLGLLAGQSKTENFTYRVTQGGQNKVEVRIVDTEGESDTTNNSRIEYFTPAQHDLKLTDIKISKAPVAGEYVWITATAKNIGDDSTLDAFDIVFEDGDGVEIGRREVSFGLLEGFSNSETIGYRIPADHTGDFQITARIEGIAQDADYSNHSRTEVFGGLVATIDDKASEIALASHIVRAVYGEEDIPEPFRGDDDNGTDDDYAGYFASLGPADQPGWQVMTDADLGSHFDDTLLTRFNEGGLYEGFVLGDAWPSWAAEALLTKGVDADGDTTLVLGFRGTDQSLEAVVSGQAFTATGQNEYYQALQPIVDAAISYANDNANGIDKLIVTGHSLAGAMVDLFTAVDGERVDADVELHAISFASAGLALGTLSPFAGVSTTIAVFDGLFLDLTAPDWYLGLSHTQDRVTYPEDDLGLMNAALLANSHFVDGLIQIELPLIANDDKSPAGFGAEHDSGLYWANMSKLAVDPLLAFHDGHNITMGRTRYDTAADLGGAAFGVFGKYVGTGDYDDDTLQGTSARDFILGMSGDDVINGNDKDDLLSGGAGADAINGGSGNDRISGGTGDDNLTGGSGDDVLQGDAGDDMLEGGSGNNIMDGGNGIDTVSYAVASGRIVASLNDATANIGGGQGIDTLLNVENLIGSRFNDRLVGNSDGNALFGADGNDVLIGRGGGNTLDGGRGDDTVTGGGFTDIVIGGEGQDLLQGLGGADMLDGGSGNDRIEAGLGNDEALGGSGDDLILGSAGRDDLLGGAGNDVMRGGNAGDYLSGDAGNDNIVGNRGNDVIFGGAGNDVLTGGDGNALGDGVRDVFVFASTANGGGGFDRIRDFENGIDKMDLSDLAYASFADVFEDAYDVGSHMEINFDAAGIVRIEHFQLADFTIGDVFL